MPSPEVTRHVRNQSSRNGLKPRIICLHTTEGHDRPGVVDLHGLASWFDNPASQASSHVGNDKEGNDSRMVADDRKAWTAGHVNGYALQIEQVGFARFSRDEWLNNRHKQLENTAAWIAYWSKKYGIPIRHSTSHGVCQHSDVSGPGGHSDCGPGYPFDYVLKLARGATPRSAKFTKTEARTIYLIQAIRERKSTAARRSEIRALKAVLLGYRAAIRAAAKASGWDRNERRARYHGLLDVYQGGRA